MRLTYIIVIIFLAIGCKGDEVIVVAPLSKVVVIRSVSITSMPFRDLHGLHWDPSDGPDVFVTVYDKNSNILSQTRGNALGNVAASMMPLLISMNAALAIESDSCYLSLWDRDNDAGDPDDLIGSTDEWISTSRLKQAGSPASIQMKNTSGEMRLVVFFSYQ